MPREITKYILSLLLMRDRSTVQYDTKCNMHQNNRAIDQSITSMWVLLIRLQQTDLWYLFAPKTKPCIQQVLNTWINLVPVQTNGIHESYKIP